MPEYVVCASASVALGFFGWLKYREYLKFMAKVVKEHGVEGLRAADTVAKPGLNIDADLPRKKLPPAKSSEGAAA